MKNYTIKITENNAKATALIRYLKSLDFIELTKTSDWWDELTPENIASIERGLDDLKHKRVHDDHEVRKAVSERFIMAKNR
jgi:hypothetical protein